MNATEELKYAYDFIESYRQGGVGDAIPEMEHALRLAVGWGQRVGSLCNEAELLHSLKYADCLNKLGVDDDETETTRQAKLRAWTAEEKRIWMDLRVMANTLKSIKMSLMMQIKTRRGER